MNMNITKSILILSTLFLSEVSFSQNSRDIFNDLEQTENGSKITVYQDSSILRLMNKQNLVNIKNKGIPNGFRIQIFSATGNDARDKAKEYMEKFLDDNPEFEPTDIYQVYQPPFFKLRIGDYRSRNDALIVYKRILKYAPNCYIIKSHINFPKLIDEN